MGAGARSRDGQALGAAAAAHMRVARPGRHGNARDRRECEDDVWEAKLPPCCAQVCSRKVTTEGIYGSSTLCFAVVDRRWARVTVACLGDSAFMLLGSSPEQPEARRLTWTPRRMF